MRSAFARARTLTRQTRSSPGPTWPPSLPSTFGTRAYRLTARCKTTRLAQTRSSSGSSSVSSANDLVDAGKSTSPFFCSPMPFELQQLMRKAALLHALLQLLHALIYLSTSPSALSTPDGAAANAQSRCIAAVACSVAAVACSNLPIYFAVSCKYSRRCSS
jgi:hypothetical protein